MTSLGLASLNWLRKPGCAKIWKMWKNFVKSRKMELFCKQNYRTQILLQWNSHATFPISERTHFSTAEMFLLNSQTKSQDFLWMVKVLTNFVIQQISWRKSIVWWPEVNNETKVTTDIFCKVSQVYFNCQKVLLRQQNKVLAIANALENNGFLLEVIFGSSLCALRCDLWGQNGGQIQILREILYKISLRQLFLWLYGIP